MVASVPELTKRHSGSPNRRRQLLGHLDGRLGGLGEVGAAGDLVAYRLDDGRMGVTGQARPVPPVEVDVLVPVDVDDLRSRRRG